MTRDISTEEIDLYGEEIERVFNKIVPKLVRDSKKFKLSTSITREAVIRFLRDKDLIEDCHDGIKGSGVFKITGYLTYWIAKLKPVQILEQDPDDNEVYINEHLAISYATSYFYEHNNIKVHSKQLVDNLLYLLRYRTLTVRILPSIYEAFIVGHNIGADESVKAVAKALEKNKETK